MSYSSVFVTWPGVVATVHTSRTTYAASSAEHDMAKVKRKALWMLSYTGCPNTDIDAGGDVEFQFVPREHGRGQAVARLLCERVPCRQAAVARHESPYTPAPSPLEVWYRTELTDILWGERRLSNSRFVPRKPGVPTRTWGVWEPDGVLPLPLQAPGARPLEWWPSIKMAHSALRARSTPTAGGPTADVVRRADGTASTLVPFCGSSSSVIYLYRVTGEPGTAIPAAIPYARLGLGPRRGVRYRALWVDEMLEALKAVDARR